MYGQSPYNQVYHEVSHVWTHLNIVLYSPTIRFIQYGQISCMDTHTTYILATHFSCMDTQRGLPCMDTQTHKCHVWTHTLYQVYHEVYHVWTPHKILLYAPTIRFIQYNCPCLVKTCPYLGNLILIYIGFSTFKPYLLFYDKKRVTFCHFLKIHFLDLIKQKQRQI